MMNFIINLPSPTNINYMWNFGSMLGLNLFLQILTGLFLSFHYSSNVDLAFDSIYYIMMNVNNGELIRLAHMNGASAFFILCYIHIGRSLYYGNYMNIKVWLSGITILLMLFTIAFLGYVLPWGQMSLWGATVITKLISALPYIGFMIVEWLWGGFSVNNATLVRFFSLHFLLPIFLVMIVFIHLIFLHENGSSNSVTNFMSLDKVSFHPYFTLKDMVGFIMFFFILFFFLNLFPNIFGDSENFNMANSMVTPSLIKPEWYFLFAYAILRSIPNKLGGVLGLLMSIIILIFVPYMDHSKIKKLNYYPLLSMFFFFFLLIFYLLTICGSKPVEWPYYTLGQLMSFFYFFYFLFFGFFKFIIDRFMI
uniref:cytochrome b n=1 Tax=Parasacculina yatsui TaxID=2836420 RepID=UPI002551D926|nr:cytochrome b [Parasacculina yatsui]WGU20853.1 cytochrome b [Parasacculina yatsui]